MEIFQTIWTALSTPNPTLINYLMLPFIFVENLVIMLLFVSLLNIPSDKRQRRLYVVLTACLGIISRLFIPSPFATYVNLIAMLLCIKFIFKTNILKTILALILPFVITILLESIFSKIYPMIFHMDYLYGMNIPLHRIIGISIIYLIILGIYKLIKYFKVNLKYIDEIGSNHKALFIVNCIFGLVLVASQLYMLTFYFSTLPSVFVILSIISLVLYFFLSIYSLTRTTKLAIVNQDLEQTKLYNNTLQILHDNMRAFKHDFANIVQAIGRICK